MAVGFENELGFGAESDELTYLWVRGGWSSASYGALRFGGAPGHCNEEDRENSKETIEEDRHPATSFPKALRASSPTSRMPGFADR